MNTRYELSFHKLDGAGNDFVGLDWRGSKLPPAEDLPQLVRLLCHRQHGIGADGMIFLLDPPDPKRYDFVMKYYNADGSCGEMCGNGARCLAVFAHRVGAAGQKMRFLTDAGDYSAELVPGGSRVRFPDVETVPERRKMLGPLREVEEMDYLHVSVPHGVAFVEDLDLLDVKTIGREARFDPAFQPAGINANFAEKRGGVINVRTYERGVEAETLACGSGSVATACCYATAQGLTGPQRIEVRPTGGDSLFITLEPSGSGFRGITLEGPGRIVFTGRCVADLKSKEIRSE